MKVSIEFKFGNDLGKFFNDFMSNPSDLISGVTVSESDSKIHIDFKKDIEFFSEKEEINNIKQYMRDNEISYNMEI